MTASTTTRIGHTDAPPTGHRELLRWVQEVAELTTPAAVVWCDGSRAEWDRLTTQLVDAGTFVRLDEKAKPSSFWCVSDPADVARVEDRTFICSELEVDAGPTNHWKHPAEMAVLLEDLYRGSMTGRTMYVIPFCMGPLGAADPKLGVQLTDSAYVAVSMQVMTRMGPRVLEALGEDVPFVKALHSVGAPLAPGQVDVAWPCSETKYISHFPETREIRSYGSGYGGNALLGKKCFSLRIASVMGRDEGWLAEHMLILKLTSPAGAVHFIAAAFPSACGKTNLAMLRPSIPGWQVETLGDDIAWMRPGADGRLYAVNPELGFFGVAPGTGPHTNPHAMTTLELGHSIFTNVALTDDNDVWWEGATDVPPAHLTDWRGQDWTPDAGTAAAHPNSRYCTPMAQCPILAPEWDDPDGVPISAIFFGGRRKGTVPLVVQSHDWQHGTFLASTLSSETTAAATGTVGVVRRDPMAMLPFIGYHVGDYLQHWIDMGATAGAQMPQIFYVNWFRRSDDGSFLWPGFGENSRVLKWAIDRIEGTADAINTAIGFVPTPEALDLDGLDMDPADLRAALTVDDDEWRAELPLIEEWFSTIGDKLPSALRAELDYLRHRLG